MVVEEFKDYFSQVSQNYRTSRPAYPSELFKYLSGLCPQNQLAWDCATGNGQAACELANHFSAVVATDASQAQIDKATAHQLIEYRVVPAENSGLAESSTDLITVAQALHWFDIKQFTKECQRVLSPDGILAVWCYKRLSISPEIDQIITDFYFGEIGEFWPVERQMVENGYADIELPFQEIEAPQFTMQANWTIEHLINYLTTWSAVSQYKQHHNRNPIDLIEAPLKQAWGNPETVYSVEWPLMLRAFKHI